MSETIQRWRPGEIIPVRHIERGVVRYAAAANVVEDSDERVVLYQPVGAATRYSEYDFATGTYAGPPKERRWHTTDRLTISYPQQAFMVSAFYHGGGGDFWCWYVDMAEPYRRWGGGIITWDQQLDIVVGRDLRWRWKDEDHLAACVKHGRYSAEEGAAIRAAGEKVVKLIEANAPPFNEPWPDWRAPKDWPMPELPDDWARVPT